MASADLQGAVAKWSTPGHEYNRSRVRLLGRTFTGTAICFKTLGELRTSRCVMFFSQSVSPYANSIIDHLLRSNDSNNPVLILYLSFFSCMCKFLEESTNTEQVSIHHNQGKSYSKTNNLGE